MNQYIGNVLSFRFQISSSRTVQAHCRAGAGVGPERAGSLASTALPVARHAGLSKFKDFQARARTLSPEESAIYLVDW